MFAVQCYTPWIISSLFFTVIPQINGFKSSHHHADYGWVFKVKDYKLKYAHMSTVEALPGDRLAHACQASAIKEGASDMSIWFQTGHATPKPKFDAATKVVSVQGYPVWGPVLHYDPVDAVLHLFYSQSGPFHPPNNTEVTNLSKSLMVGGEIRVVKSHDGGHTWDAPTTILAYNAGGVYDGAAKVTANKPAVLANGSWVLPFWQETPGTNNSFSAHNSMAKVGSWHPGSCAGVLLSHDRGHTWTPSGCIGNHYLIENTVAPVDDKGHLLMLFRSGGSPLYQSRSADWGVTWSNATATSIPNPNSKVINEQKQLTVFELELGF